MKINFRYADWTEIKGHNELGYLVNQNDYNKIANWFEHEERRLKFLLQVFGMYVLVNAQAIWEFHPVSL